MILCCAQHLISFSLVTIFLRRWRLSESVEHYNCCWSYREHSIPPDAYALWNWNEIWCWVILCVKMTGHWCPDMQANTTQDSSVKVLLDEINMVLWIMAKVTIATQGIPTTQESWYIIWDSPSKTYVQWQLYSVLLYCCIFLLRIIF